MTPREIREKIGDVPYMSLEQGETMTEFIRENRIKRILELGFCYGTSTCYMAEAVSPDGNIVTIDLRSAQIMKPNVEELLFKIGQRDRVEVLYEKTSYTWRLMKFLEAVPRPMFDMVFIDGAHDWFVNGFAFLLSDKLLRVGGWIIFDDLHWTQAGSAEADGQPFIDDEETRTAQVNKIDELLVKTHPCYGNFKTEDRWAYAQKISETPKIETRTEYVVKAIPIPFAKIVSRIRRLTAAPSPQKLHPE